MMKKAVLFISILLVCSCSSTKKSTASKPLYEILTTQNDGGANIRFNEILSEEKEIKMLLGDENLRKKIKPEDLKTSNFVILNMGEKNSTGYSIKVKNVVETADKIIITTEDAGPKQEIAAGEEFSYPYTIIKINSKKAIVIE
jgi:hypothetical protein